MTAVVSSLAQPFPALMHGADARKRRREILSTQRTSPTSTMNSTTIPNTSSSTITATAPDNTQSCPDLVGSDEKRRRVSLDCSSKNSNSKKPQMRYDPEVPMTKEAAALWRREQRRKRNRESAAASRQRQRDRISELEVEINGYQDKYNSMMDKIKKLETIAAEKNLKIDGVATPATPPAPMPIQTPSKMPTSAFVSPPSSPRPSQMCSASDDEASPVVSSSNPRVIATVNQSSPELPVVAESQSDAEDEKQPIKMISRQATS